MEGVEVQLVWINVVKKDISNICDVYDEYESQLLLLLHKVTWKSSISSNTVFQIEIVQVNIKLSLTVKKRQEG